MTTALAQPGSVTLILKSTSFEVPLDPSDPLTLVARVSADVHTTFRYQRSPVFSVPDMRHMDMDLHVSLQHVAVSMCDRSCAHRKVRPFRFSFACIICSSLFLFLDTDGTLRPGT